MCIKYSGVILKIEFKSSFIRDLEHIKDNTIRDRARKIIESAQKAQVLQEIGNIKKLKHGDHYYRIRIKDYRIGLALERDILTFVRILQRKDLYRYFP